MQLRLHLRFFPLKVILILMTIKGADFHTSTSKHWCNELHNGPHTIGII